MTHRIDRVHHQVENHTAKTVAVATEDGRVELVQANFDTGVGFLDNVAVDDVAYEIAQLLGNVEFFVEVVVLLLHEIVDAVVHTTYPANAVQAVPVRADAA